MVDRQDGWAVFHSDDGLEHVLKTADGGLTWIDVSPPVSLDMNNADGRSIHFRFATGFLDADHGWASPSYDGHPSYADIWRTVDGGMHWERGLLGRRNYGLDSMTIDFVDPSYGWALIDIFHGAGSHTGELFRTSDGGATWERMLANFGYASNIDFVDRQVGWITTDVFSGVSPPWTLSITRDGGLTWETHYQDSLAAQEGPIEGYSECNFAVFKTLSARAGVVLRPRCRSYDEQGIASDTSWLDFTTDEGQTWQSVQMPHGFPMFLNANVGWVIGPTDWVSGQTATDWSLFKTRDGGRSWSPVTGLDWHGDVDFVDERNGWGLDDEGKLRRTMDGGLAWEEVSPRSIIAVSPEDVTSIVNLPVELDPITLTNATKLQQLAALPASDPTSLVIFRDTLFVGNAHGQLLQWDLSSKVHEQPAIWRIHDDWVYDLAAVDEGGDLFSASRDGLVRRWPLFALDGWWQEFPIHTEEVTSVALSPNGSILASGGEDGTVKLQEIPNAAPPELRLDLRGQQGWVWDVAFSSDGKTLASASGDGNVRLWSAETGDLLATLGGHTSAVSQVAFAPRGPQIASASWDGTVCTYDPTTYDTLSVLQGHDDWVLGLAYAPAGGLLVSSGADGKVLLWDADKGKLISQLVDLDAPMRGVTFDAQGRYLIAIADDDRVLIWGVPDE